MNRLTLRLTILVATQKPWLKESPNLQVLTSTASNAVNTYDDSQLIQNEAYGDLRSAVANLPSEDMRAQYDTIFMGSPTKLCYENALW